MYELADAFDDHDHHQHAHAHHDHHAHDSNDTHGASLVDANAAHFDAEASAADDSPVRLELARRLARALRAAYAFDEDATTVMDYACGTGLVSRALAPHARVLVGVDVSQGAVARYNLRVANQGIPPAEMRAVCAELRGDARELAALGGARFDVVICTMAYHHFADIAETTRVLAFFLKPGGSLLVADIMKRTNPAPGGSGSGSNSNSNSGSGAGAGAGEEPDEVIPKRYHHIVAHTAGLGEADMRGAFEGAGLGAFAFRVAARARTWGTGREVDFFVASGVKPLENDAGQALST